MFDYQYTVKLGRFCQYAQYNGEFQISKRTKNIGIYRNSGNLPRFQIFL